MTAVTAAVIPSKCPWPILLGTPWLRQNAAMADFERNLYTIRSSKGKQIVIPGIGTAMRRKTSNGAKSSDVAGLSSEEEEEESDHDS